MADLEDLELVLSDSVEYNRPISRLWSRNMNSMIRQNNKSAVLWGDSVCSGSHQMMCFLRETPKARKDKAELKSSQEDLHFSFLLWSFWKKAEKHLEWLWDGHFTDLKDNHVCATLCTPYMGNCNLHEKFPQDMELCSTCSRHRKAFSFHNPSIQKLKQKSYIIHQIMQNLWRPITLEHLTSREHSCGTLSNLHFSPILDKWFLPPIHQQIPLSRSKWNLQHCYHLFPFVPTLWHLEWYSCHFIGFPTSFFSPMQQWSSIQLVAHSWSLKQIISSCF